MNSFKDWLLEAGLKTAGPSAIRGSILGIVGWLAMKQNFLMGLGIVTDPTEHITIIHWDQLSTWAIAALPAVAAGLIKLFQHTGTTIMTNKGDQPK